MKRLWIPICLLGAGLSGCYNDKMNELYPTAQCVLDSVTYSGTMKSITSQNCAISGCHTAVTLAGGYNLETYTDLHTIALSGDLLGTVRHDAGHSPMPQNAAKLPDCTIKKIEKWVADGAPNN